MAMSYANRIKVGKLIADRETFRYGNMSGKWVESFPSLLLGELDPHVANTMFDLLQETDLYVVYSYGTPIAYAFNRTMHVPDIKYSVTTSHHQSTARLADHYKTLNKDLNNPNTALNHRSA